jgi:hypothetical protein
MVSVFLARGTCLMVLAIVSLFFICGCLTSESSSEHRNLPDFIENKAQLLISDLTEQGYEVQRGYLKLYTTDDCEYSYRVMENCYGNNPAAPYVLPAVPYWENEFRDAATYNAFGPIRDGYGATFRFDRSEAILIFGILPPPAAYFGFQTYHFHAKERITRTAFSTDFWHRLHLFDFQPSLGQSPRTPSVFRFFPV